MLVLLGQGLVLFDVEFPVLRPLLGMAMLCGLPVWVLLRRVRWGHTRSTAAVVYALGVAALALMVVGLALNTLLPLASIDHPLARPFLVGASTLTNVSLLAWRRDVPLVTTAELRRLLRTVLTARFELAATLGSVGLACSVMGAVRLNNQQGSAVAVVGLAFVGAAFLALIARRVRSLSHDGFVVYVASAALLLATSLRGWYITGHDIQREYLVFQLTQQADRWAMSAYPDPYNACLSINILPSILASFTGISGLYVFKLLLQLLFAIVPVAVYLVGRRLVGRRLALIGAVFFVTFPTFFSDMPFLVRQEVAFVFLSGAFLAATERCWSIRRRQVAVLVAGVGVVLSHYATTYMLLAVLVIGVAGALGSRLWARRRAHPQGSPEPFALLSRVVIAGLMAFTWVWTVPATHTGGHFQQTARESISELFGSGNVTGSSDLAYGIFSRASLSPQERLDKYTKESKKTAGASDTVLGGKRRSFRPESVQLSPLPLTPTGEGLEAVGIDVQLGNSLMRSGAAALFQVFLLVGFAAMWSRSRLVRRVNREVRWLVTGSLGALGVMMIVSGLSVEYGVLRAFQQVLLFASPVLAVGAATVLRPLGGRAVAAAGGIAMVMYASLSGVIPTLLGGYPGQLALSNQGQYYDLYYVTEGEVSAARWLASAQSGGVPPEVVSDPFTVLWIQNHLAPDERTSDEFYPTELQTGNYVFVGRATAQRGVATLSYDGDLLAYRYPLGLLESQFNRIYDSGDAEVYR